MVDLTQQSTLTLEFFVLQRVNLLAKTRQKTFSFWIFSELVVEMFDTDHVDDSNLILIKVIVLLSDIYVTLSLFHQITQQLLSLESKQKITLKKNKITFQRIRWNDSQIVDKCESIHHPNA